MQISLMRIYDNIAHAALVGEIGNLNLAQQANGITLQSRLVDDTGILQDLLLEADATQKLSLLTLGSMISCSLFLSHISNATFWERAS